MTSQFDNNLPHELPSLSTSLLNRVQQMQPEAWSRLVCVFSPIVYRWARKTGLSAQDASDIVQDVFIAVSKNIADFERQKDKASFRSWLATITRNRVRDRFRKNDRMVTAFGGTEALNMLQASPDPFSELESAEVDCPNNESSSISDELLDQTINLKDLDRGISNQVMKQVKQNCDDATWQAFWLTTIEELPAADVSEKLVLNISSVYQAKSRILRRLRQRMDELP